MFRLASFLFLLAFFASTAHAQQKKAFIVGVQDYASLQDLTRTIEDANGYSGVFKNDLGFAVTPLASNPKRGDFNRAFGAFLETIKPGDEIVFVFSGHGWSDGAENYLVFADARADASEFELKEDTIALSRSVLQRIRDRNPSLIVAIIDACRDNPFTGNKNAFEKGLARVEAVEGTLVVYAAGERQKARDRLNDADKAPYSLFTRVLLPKLRDPNRPIMDTLDETRDEVERQANTIRHKQRPAIYSDVSNKFCFSGNCTRGTALADPELDLWKKATQGTAAARCAASHEYLRLYAGGQYAAAAEIMALKSCESAPSPSLASATPPRATAMPAPMRKVGSVFRDPYKDGSGSAPEMVVLPPGRFIMGSPISEERRSDEEGPQRTVKFGYTLAVGKYEITWAQWDACVDDGACDDAGPENVGGDGGWGRGTRPAMNVDWNDAQAFVSWLNEKTGLTGKTDRYRLLSEAEWEYAARAKTKTAFSFGATISTDQANYDGEFAYPGGRRGKYLEKTAPVGSYPANAFGLYDMHGNVGEWVEDCFAETYFNAPLDGSPVVTTPCDVRISRGGGWSDMPQHLRAAVRYGWTADVRLDKVGFRVARTLLQ